MELIAELGGRAYWIYKCPECGVYLSQKGWSNPVWVHKRNNCVHSEAKWKIKEMGFPVDAEKVP